MNEPTVCTPCEIIALLQIYFLASGMPERADAPAVRDAINRYLHEDMIVSNDAGGWRCTAKGQAMVQKWCSVPLPVSIWV